MSEDIAMVAQLAAGLHPGLLVGLIIGLLIGLAYFRLLAGSARNLTDGASFGAAFGLLALRLSLAIAGFRLIAGLGALPLLGALAGFLIARVIVQSLILGGQA